MLSNSRRAGYFQDRFEGSRMEYQVRVTRVKPGRMDDFVAEWTGNLARIRRRRGFTIVAAFVLDDTDDDFFWILGYDGEEGLDAAEQAYATSEERTSIDPDPGRLIEYTEVKPGRRVV